ncbi:hypothetical protein RNZ50_13710 [Paracoccaceae bacterium Fryx2]|nr:hypothetical protein [Paracoccaceae bacterium Fryx2]
MRKILALALLLPLPAFGQDALTAGDFEAYATGKTLSYALAGEIYGAEQYLPNRRVRWAFKDDTCRDGYWYEAEGLICFVYEHDATPQCWSFYLEDGSLLARYAGDAEGSELSEVAQTPVPLICAGPDLGV